MKTVDVKITWLHIELEHLGMLVYPGNGGFLFGFH